MAVIMEIHGYYFHRCKVCFAHRGAQIKTSDTKSEYTNMDIIYI